MKSICTLSFLLIFVSISYSQNYYYYKSSKIVLQQRTDKIAIILNNKNYSQEIVRENLRNFVDSRDSIKKLEPDVYILKYFNEKSFDEIKEHMNSISRDLYIVKFSTNVFYGSSKKVTQIPTDRFLVKLKNKNDEARLNAINVLNNCSIIGKFGNENGFIIKTNSNVNKNALELSDIYYTTGIFEFAEPDFLYPENCLFLSVPNDPNFPKQWSLQNTGQTIQTGSTFAFYGDAATVNGIPGSDMNVTSAWDFTTGSDVIKIGVIDTGIDSLHPDFQQAGHLLSGYDAVNNVNSSAIDIGWHGTSTAGIIGAVMNNSIGISGIAPNCKLMSILITDAEGNTYSSEAARAFDSAVAKGLDVLSNSWGGGTPSSIVTDAIDNAAVNGRNGLGCAILFASGNDGNNPPLYPSVLPNVLSVGASTPHDQAKSPGTGNYFFWGSNYGENSIGDLDVLAPTSCVTLAAGGGLDQFFWGTSASCPNAAGVAALILSINSSQTRAEVYNNLTRGCDKIDNVPYDIDKPFGKWSHYNGYGRVNALNSVRLAAGVDVTPPVINHLNVSSSPSTYPTDVVVEISDQDGAPVPVSGSNQPKLFYKIKRSTASWTSFDSLCSYSNSGNSFTFRIPSQGWETEVKYYIRARDITGNENTFPKHAPNAFNLCYFAIGNITKETKKIPAFSGADYGATVSPSVNFGNFKVLDAKVIISMRHTYLDDEIIQIFSPLTDANNSRKCLFASNGGAGDNIYSAGVSDSETNFWSDNTPPFQNGNFKPEYNMRGLNGNSASGSWKILHFDRGLTDYAFFDSVKIILSKTTGTTSSAINIYNSSDSIINFDSSFEISDRNFYLKNSGTANLIISGVSFLGEFSEMFSIINTPPSHILPNDSGLFIIRFDNQSGGNPNNSMSGESPIFNIQTNDPSKPEFKVSLQTNSPNLNGIKNLTLTAIPEGLYDPAFNSVTSDSLRVLIRKSFPPYEILDSATSLINSSGVCDLTFGNLSNDSNYYIVLKYRNGINTWSSTGNHFTNSVLNYDFTDSSSKAFGSNMVLKGNKYCIWSGDVNKDNVIDGGDISSVENAIANSLIGYEPEDINNDGIVDASDMGLVENNSTKLINVISP